MSRGESIGALASLPRLWGRDDSLVRGKPWKAQSCVQLLLRANRRMRVPNLFFYKRIVPTVMGYLGNEGWRNFAGGKKSRKSVLDKAIEAIEGQGFIATDHCVQVDGMVEIGSGAARQVIDYHLNRFLVYHIPMNADSSKNPVDHCLQGFLMLRSVDVDNPLHRQYPTMLE